jgi:hypothetical protein
VTAIDVTPSESPFVRLTLGDSTPTELTVAASDGKPFAVLGVEADPTVTVTVRPPDGQPPTKKQARTKKALATGSGRYLVSIVPKPDLPLGQTVANVTLTTDRPKAERVAIRAVLMVVGVVRVDPDRLIVRPEAEVPVLHARLRKAESGDPLRILAVESSDADFSASFTPVRDGREYDVAVRYTGKPGRGVVNGRITVKTSEPTQPAIVIPLAGRL